MEFSGVWHVFKAMYEDVVLPHGIRPPLPCRYHAKAVKQRYEFREFSFRPCRPVPFQPNHHSVRQEKYHNCIDSEKNSTRQQDICDDHLCFRVVVFCMIRKARNAAMVDEQLNMRRKIPVLEKIRDDFV